MFTEITLKNFKCFKEKTHFPLSQINLLTGVNGGGKSSMLQALLLLQQSFDIDETTEALYLNGPMLELGTLEDVKNSETVIGTPIELTFSYDTNYACTYSLATSDLKINDKVISVNLEDRHLKFIEKIIHYSDKSFSTERFDTTPNPKYLDIDNSLTHYIAADRIGPQNFYLYTNMKKWYVRTDKQGKYAPYVLFNKQNDAVHESLCLGKNAQTVLQQTEEWLNEIFDGAKVELKTEQDTIGIYYNTKQTVNRYKSVNVGFGYSYILPIIVSGLIAQEIETLIVENPEAHLHPKAQSKLTKFLAKVASCGVQVFIETHSEHILNALRVVSVSKDYDIKNTDISVLYFQNDDNQLVTPIPINPDGGIDTWPDGFFDQTDKDFKILFGF